VGNIADPQTIDLIERWGAGTVVKHRLENRDRFATQGAPVGKGTLLLVFGEGLRKVLDQQSKHAAQ
jgi:hypothetical protein